MTFDPEKKTSNVILLIASFVIVSLILWNTNSFFKKFKEEERLKMEIWATAQSEFLSLSADADPGNLPLKVFQNNTSTPMI
ncbi:MAG: sensor histidine kinase, partial [Saonia sp.]